MMEVFSTKVEKQNFCSDCTSHDNQNFYILCDGQWIVFNRLKLKQKNKTEFIQFLFYFQNNSNPTQHKLISILKSEGQL
jgi:hypothetical protein